MLEISENSLLISQNIRLPVFGKPYQLIERTKSSISKRGYLLKKHPEYTNKISRNYLFQNNDLGFSKDASVD